MSIIKVENIYIAGIPCGVEVEAWQAEPMTWWEPGCPAGWELYRVLDRKGYVADWLEDQRLDELAQDDIDAHADYLYEQQRERSWGL